MIPTPYIIKKISVEFIIIYLSFIKSGFLLKNSFILEKFIEYLYSISIINIMNKITTNQLKIICFIGAFVSLYFTAIVLPINSKIYPKTTPNK